MCLKRKELKPRPFPPGGNKSRVRIPANDFGILEVSYNSVRIWGPTQNVARGLVFSWRLKKDVRGVLSDF